MDSLISSIQLENVSKYYGPVCAMSGVSLLVRPGSLTAILGPSGSGKSTMLSLIAGIAMPSDGRIWIGGHDVTHIPSAQRNVGLVFQSYALFPHLSVYENVAFPLRIRRLPAARIAAQVEEALERVRLTDFKTRRPSQLSGGQQQRVALARAIVFKPAVLLLDEPLAALDRKLRDEVRLELRHLQHELGVTTVLVTHDQEEAMSMADEIVVMAEGRIQQIDTPRNAYSQPANSFVATFLGIANLFEGKLVAEGKNRHILIDGGDRIAVSEASAPKVRAKSVSGILRPEQIAFAEPSAPGALRARVDERIFLGERTRYIVTSEAGTTITLQTSNQGLSPCEGTIVGLTWDARDVWILPERASSH